MVEADDIRSSEAKYNVANLQQGMLEKSQGSC